MTGSPHINLAVGQGSHTVTDTGYWSIPPNQNKMQAWLGIVEQSFCLLFLSDECFKLLEQMIIKFLWAATSVKAFFLAGSESISTSFRDQGRGASHARRVLVHCLALRSCPSAQSGPSGSGSGSGSGHKRHLSSGSANQFGGRKSRSSQKRKDGNTDKSNNGDGRDPGGANSPSKAQQPPPSFSCPFNKLDPIKYGDCIRYKLTRWTDVLQHIKRVHLVKGEHCPDCRTEFKGEQAEDLKDEHIRNVCQPATYIETGRILQGEYDRLACLPGSPEEKWYGGWRTLFPEFPSPSSVFADTFETLLQDRCRILQGPVTGLLGSLLHQQGHDLGHEDLDTITRIILDGVLDPSSIFSITRAQIASAGPSASLGPDLNELPQQHSDISLFVPLVPGGAGFLEENEDLDQYLDFSQDGAYLEGINDNMGL